MKQIKAIVIGDRNTGKTTWISQVIGVKFKIKPTISIDLYNMEYNGAEICFWDNGISGMKPHDGADCAFIFYTERSQVEKYKQEILEVVGKKIPYVAVNLAEIQDPQEPLRRLFKK